MKRLPRAVDPVCFSGAVRKFLRCAISSGLRRGSEGEKTMDWAALWPNSNRQFIHILLNSNRPPFLMLTLWLCWVEVLLDVSLLLQPDLPSSALSVNLSFLPVSPSRYRRRTVMQDLIERKGVFWRSRTFWKRTKGEPWKISAAHKSSSIHLLNAVQLW